MDFFYIYREIPELEACHFKISMVILALWILFSYLGVIIKSKSTVNKISIALIVFSFIQEIFDYINRSTNIYYNHGEGLALYNDLPLQLCHVSYWLSVFLIGIMVFNKYIYLKQFVFNSTYYFSLSGALLGIITVDLEGINTYGDILFLDLQHSIIILNILWLIFAYKFEFSLKGITQSFIVINMLALIVGTLNYIIPNGPNLEDIPNYMFLREPPLNGNHLFIIGPWPYYIIGFEFIFFFYGLLIYIPFWIKNKLR